MAMSNVLAGIVLVLPILFLIPFGLVYGEIQTRDGKYDFNFTDIEIFQDPEELRKLIIEPHVIFVGSEELGSVDIEVTITDPEGFQYATQIGRINEVPIRAVNSTGLYHYLTMEGTYTIDFDMKNTSIEYPNHSFGEKSIEFTVKKNGFKKILNPVVFEDDDANKIFILSNAETIKNNELVQVMFDLPETHSFEKIGIVNGDYNETFDIDKSELFLKSEFGYEDMKLYLIKEGSLLPFADAQSEFLDYVTFFVVNQNICYSENCESIDYDSTPSPFSLKSMDKHELIEYVLLWWWLIIPVITIIAFVIKFVIKTKSNRTVENNIDSDIKNNNIDSDITKNDTDKNSEYEISHRY